VNKGQIIFSQVIGCSWFAYMGAAIRWAATETDTHNSTFSIHLDNKTCFD